MYIPETFSIFHIARHDHKNKFYQENDIKDYVQKTNSSIVED